MSDIGMKRKAYEINGSYTSGYDEAVFKAKATNESLHEIKVTNLFY